MLIKGIHPKHGTVLPMLWEAPKALEEDNSCCIMGLTSQAGSAYNGSCCLLGAFQHSVGRWDAKVPEA